MTFFFSEFENTKKSSKKQIPINTAKALGCLACPLKQTKALNTDMAPAGSTTPTYYFLGEAPTYEDDQFGKPFTSKAGMLLTSFFPRNWENTIRLNNVVRTHTPDHRKPEPIEIECCRKSIVEDIEKAQPKLIIAVGQTALQWLLPKVERLDITKWRGRWFSVKVGKHICWATVISDPANILRFQRFNKSGTLMPNEHDKVFEMDMKNVFKNLKTLDKPFIIEKDYLSGVQTSEGLKSDKELQKVLNWLEEFSNVPFVGFDYETSCLRPFEKDAKLLSVAIGTDKKSVSFPLEYPNAWNPDQWKILKVAMIDFFKSPTTKICHNLKFELEWTIETFGKASIYLDCWEDTQAQAYVLDERRGMLNLDILIRLHFGFMLKDLSNIDRSRMLSYPLEKILPYNALDSKWTYSLFMEQRKRLNKEPKLLNVYKNLVRTCQTLASVQCRGVVLNDVVRLELKNKFEKEVALIAEKISTLPEVEQFKTQFRMPFNPASPDHVLKCLNGVLGLTDELMVEGKMNTSEAVLSSLKGYDLPELILDFRGITKKITTYLEPMADYVTPKYRRIHTNFNPFDTSTGRLCVAKGTLVEIVRDYSKLPEGVPVEDVKVGDYVYTYDENLQIVLRKVLWSGKTGLKKVMRLHWIGDGRKTSGYLDITKNHPVRLINGTYVRADELSVRDRVLSLTRTVKAGRSFFYQTGRKEVISDQRFVFEQFFGDIANSSDHVHHKDGNSLNNVPSNLELLTSSVHTSLHATEHWSDPENVAKMVETRRNRIESGEIVLPSGDQHYAWKHYTKYQFFRLIAKSKGDITKLGIDYKTFLNKCQHHQIDYKNLCLRYSKQGKYSSKAKMLNLAEEFGPTRSSRMLGIDYTKLTLMLRSFGWVSPRSCGTVTTKYQLLRALAKARGRVGSLKGRGFSDLYKVKKYAELFGIDLKAVKRRYTQDGVYIPSYSPNNHQITKIEWLEELVDVYDLEVEDTHNFIANGICVSNSSDSPNLQNLPNKTGKEIRKMFTAPEDHWIVSSDYGQIEARLIGVASQDEAFCDALWNDYDVHMKWAEIIAGEYPAVVGGERFLSDKKAMKTFRAKVKNLWVFPAFYGASPFSIAKGIGVPIEIVQDVFNDFWKTFKGVKRWQKWILNRYDQLGYVETLTGRRRHAPLSMNAVLNASIQGCASDICVDAMCRLDRLGYNVIMNIHDDVTSYIPDNKLEESIEHIAEEMCMIPFKWMNIPISIEISAGLNWYEQEEIGTFKSTSYHDVPRKLVDFTKMYD